MQTRMEEAALPGLAVLEQTPILIEKIVSTASEEQLHWKPSMERWSIAEVLGHLAEAEDMAFRGRLKRMVEEEKPQLPSYDQNQAYLEGKYHGRARENLKKFCHERDRSLSYLRYLPATASGRTGEHAQLGPITVGQLMNEWAFHDLGHIRQISELLRARAYYPQMGPFQKYYKVNP